MPPAIGGISVSTARLRDRLVNDGHEVETYNLQMDVPHVAHALWQMLNMFWLPFYVLGKRKFDIVHLHISGYWRRVWFRLVKPFFKGASIVVTIHGDVANFINYPFCESVLAAADRIICVRRGNIALLPKLLKSRSVEIPAFIMPPASSIAAEKIPESVVAFVDEAQRSGCPLLVFNGSVVLKEPFYDLYGFKEMAAIVKRLHDNGIKIAALMIVNDMHLDASQCAFLQDVESRLDGCGSVMLCSKMQFSLLPLLSRGNAIYVRPTKTDGDSLSVRESLALGAQVVASSAAPRPEGTRCYDLASGEDGLYKRIVDAIEELESDHGCNSVAFKDYYDKIIEVYSSL